MAQTKKRGPARTPPQTKDGSRRKDKVPFGTDQKMRRYRGRYTA